MDRSKRAEIDRLCSRVDAMGKGGITPGHDFVEVAIQLGGLVRKLKAAGAYRSCVVVEERLDAAAEGKLFGQWVKGPIKPYDGGPDHYVMAANQPDYMVFWIARQAASLYAGLSGDCETNAANVASGCSLITDHIRQEWDIRIPPKVIVLEQVRASASGNRA